MRFDKLYGSQFLAVLIWVVVSLGVPYQFLLQAAPAVMVQPLMAFYHVSELSIGLLTSCYFYTYLLCQIPAGLLIDRYGVRKVLSISIALTAISCLCFAMSRTFWFANFSRLMMGMFTAPSVPAIMYLSSGHYSPRRFALLAGLSEGIGMLMAAIGEVILAEVVAFFGWSASMYGYAVLGFLMALLVWVIVPDTVRAANEGDGNYFKARLMKLCSQFVFVLKSSQLWLIAIWCGLVFAVIQSLAGLWVIQTLESLYKVKLQIAAMGGAVMFIGAAIGLLFWGWLSEYVDGVRKIMLGATVVDFILVAAFVYIPNIMLSVLFLFLFVVGFFSGVYVLGFAAVRFMVPDLVRASAMGFVNMMSMIVGAPLLQPLIGYIIQSEAVRHGQHWIMEPITYRYALTPLTGCILMAIGVLALIKKTVNKQVSC